MNTTGFLRGYMAKNMSAQKFINVVIDGIAKEFEDEVAIDIISKEEYEIVFKKYRFIISNKVIDELKSKSPYAVDKFLLMEFKKQGFDFDEERSQYKILF